MPKWTPPRTWRPLDMDGAGHMNAQVRDNMLLLKTDVDNDGKNRSCLMATAFSSGQGNGAGSVDTALTSFNYSLKAGSLSQPGDALVAEFMVENSAQAGTKLLKLGVGASTLLTVFSTTLAVVTYHAVYLRIARRLSTSVAVLGNSTGSTGNATAVTLTLQVNNSATNCNWDIDQTLVWYANAANANDLRIREMTLYAGPRSLLGALV